MCLSIHVLFVCLELRCVLICHSLLSSLSRSLSLSLALFLMFFSADDKCFHVLILRQLAASTAAEHVLQSLPPPSSHPAPSIQCWSCWCNSLQVYVGKLFRGCHGCETDVFKMHDLMLSVTGKEDPPASIWPLLLPALSMRHERSRRHLTTVPISNSFVLWLQPVFGLPRGETKVVKMMFGPISPIANSFVCGFDTCDRQGYNA